MHNNLLILDLIFDFHISLGEIFGFQNLSMVCHSPSRTTWNLTCIRQASWTQAKRFMPAIAVGRYSDGGYSCGQYSHLVIRNLRYQGLSVAHLPRVRHEYYFTSHMCSPCITWLIGFLKAKFHYPIWFEAGRRPAESWNLTYHLACYSSELARASRSATGPRPASNQLQTR